LRAWQDNIGIDLDAWECRTLLRMSDAFLNFRSEARKPNCPAPYTGTDEDVTSGRDQVDRQAKAFFASLKGKRG
jgi:hypothetical protein